MTEHINDQGEFIDPDHPWCRPGHVAFDLDEPNVQRFLWEFAERFMSARPDVYSALQNAIESKGYVPPGRCPKCHVRALVEHGDFVTCMQCGNQSERNVHEL